MIVQFAPQQNDPFQFQASLDGTVYNAVVKWNVYGERYYLNLYTVAGVRIYTCALVGSTPEYPIALLPPLNPATHRPWASTLYYIDATSTFVVLP